MVYGGAVTVVVRQATVLTPDFTCAPVGRAVVRSVVWSVGRGLSGCIAVRFVQRLTYVLQIAQQHEHLVLQNAKTEMSKQVREGFRKEIT